MRMPWRVADLATRTRTVGIDPILPSVFSVCERVDLTCLVLLLIMQRLHYYPRVLESGVAGHLGPCVPVWLETNQIVRRIEGAGSGFFRRVIRLPHVPFAVTVGPEFHGYIYRGTVLTTEGIYGALPV